MANILVKLQHACIEQSVCVRERERERDISSSFDDDKKHI
jgi:hypothetical protein